jgi:hypothetical protein
MAWPLGVGAGIRGRATELGMVAYYYKVIDNTLVTVSKVFDRSLPGLLNFEKPGKGAYQ